MKLGVLMNVMKVVYLKMMIYVFVYCKWDIS